MHKFIVIDGIDGSGKGTILTRLIEWLKINTKIKFYRTEEPFDKKTRKQLKETHFTPVRQLDLLIEDRREHCRFIVKPMLDCGFWVFCDRFTPSTLAYQGYGHGLDIPRIQRLNSEATEGLKPDLTIILDCFVENALSRKTEPLDCMESDRPFLERVRLGYLELAGQNGWTVIDANQSEDLVFEEVKKLIVPMIPEEDREYLKARLF